MNRAVNGPLASKKDKVADIKLEAYLLEACTDENGCMDSGPSTGRLAQHNTSYRPFGFARCTA